MFYLVRLVLIGSALLLPTVARALEISPQKVFSDNSTAVSSAPKPEPPPAEIIEVTRIWDRAPHNAFTDLIRFKDAWFCVFREAQRHGNSPEGAVRVITSTDGAKWTSAALLNSSKGDVRDSKITITPDNLLMLSGAVALTQPAAAYHQSMVWFSPDGRQWDEGIEVAEPNIWLWRVTWHKKTAYGIGYATRGARFVRLYKSSDGKSFETLVDKLFLDGYPNEHSLVFLKDDTCICLLRRDMVQGGKASAQLGIAQPPYTNWFWKDLGIRVGGPHMILLPDGRIVAAVRLYADEKNSQPVRTSLCWIDYKNATIKEFLKLPSGGDTSYPGLIWHEGLLWVSYYSSHEGKTSIYLAKVKLN